MKRFKLIALALMLTLIFTQPVAANITEPVTSDKLIAFKISDTSYYILTLANEELVEVKMDTAPIIEFNRTFVPVRFLGNALGVSDSNIEWDDSSKTAILKANKELRLSIGKSSITVNGVSEDIDVAPLINNNRTMLPARFVAEGLGYTVDWDADKELVIVYQGAKPDISALITKLNPALKPAEAKNETIPDKVNKPKPGTILEGKLVKATDHPKYPGWQEVFTNDGIDFMKIYREQAIEMGLDSLYDPYGVAMSLQLDGKIIDINTKNFTKIEKIVGDWHRELPIKEDGVYQYVHEGWNDVGEFTLLYHLKDGTIIRAKVNIVNLKFAGEANSIRSEDKNVILAIDNDKQTVNVKEATTVGQLKNALLATDGSAQQYKVQHTLSNILMEDDEILREYDRLTVTSSSAREHRFYTVLIGSPKLATFIVESDGEPIEGAELTIVGEGKTVVTDARGRASLELETGEFVVFIKAEGYQDFDNASINKGSNKLEHGIGMAPLD